MDGVSSYSLLFSKFYQPASGPGETLLRNVSEYGGEG